MKSINEVIYGKVPSKSNSYKIITINGHYSMGKTADLKSYEKAFYLQCKNKNANITGKFIFEAIVYYMDNRPDLDNSSKILLDCLQSCNVIKNDRYCFKLILEKRIDKNSPRVELKIMEL